MHSGQSSNHRYIFKKRKTQLITYNPGLSTVQVEYVPKERSAFRSIKKVPFFQMKNKLHSISPYLDHDEWQ